MTIGVYGKVWGKTVPIFSQNNVEIHRIEVEGGGFSSKHRHRSKYNMFYVEHGFLEIHVWKNDYSLVDVTILRDGDSTVVAPGEFHQFVAKKRTIAYEIYWAALDPNDIERENHGHRENILTKRP